MTPSLTYHAEKGKGKAKKERKKEERRKALTTSKQFPKGLTLKSKPLVTYEILVILFTSFGILQ